MKRVGFFLFATFKTPYMQSQQQTFPFFQPVASEHVTHATQYEGEIHTIQWSFSLDILWCRLSSFLFQSPDFDPSLQIPYSNKSFQSLFYNMETFHFHIQSLQKSGYQKIPQNAQRIEWEACCPMLLLRSCGDGVRGGDTLRREVGGHRRGGAGNDLVWKWFLCWCFMKMKGLKIERKRVREIHEYETHSRFASTITQLYSNSIWSTIWSSGENGTDMRVLSSPNPCFFHHWTFYFSKLFLFRQRERLFCERVMIPCLQKKVHKAVRDGGATEVGDRKVLSIELDPSSIPVLVAWPGHPFLF